jgi:hypothetical protein
VAVCPALVGTQHVWVLCSVTFASQVLSPPCCQSVREIIKYAFRLVFSDIYFVPVYVILIQLIQELKGTDAHRHLMRLDIYILITKEDRKGGLSKLF